jgi:small subunit ribosomal protein S16
MVIIRLQRRGTKKVYHHRIVVADRARAQSGKVIEILGYYDPSFEPEKFELNEDRYAYWVREGAQVTLSVANLAKKFKKIALATIRN